MASYGSVIASDGRKFVLQNERMQGETWRKLWEMRMVRVGPAPAR